MSFISKAAIGAAILPLAVKKILVKFAEVDPVIALGTNQATAAPLTSGKNTVTAADGTVGVRLPPAQAGATVQVINTVSNQTLKVYAAVGEVINAIGTTAAFSQVGGAFCTYMCDVDAHWYVAAANLTGTSTSATTLQLDQAAIPASSVEVVTATNVIAATESGMTYFLNSATEFVSTLPAAAAGLRFTFIVAAAPSGASYTVVTNSSANIIKGLQQSVAGDAGDSGTADDTITFVDGQAVAGDRVDVISDGTSWFAYANSKVAAGITFTQAS